MSGSAKGVTASQNKGAIFIRTRGTGSKKRTADQATIKSIFRTLTQSWKNLGQADIVAWNNAAKSQSGRRVLGQKAQLTGSNLYLRLNFWVVRCGGQPLTSPPNLVGVEQTAQVSLMLTDDSLMFHLLQTPQVEGLKLVIMATAPQTVGTVTGVGRGSTFCEPLQPTTNYVNLMQQYQAKFGIPNSGKPKIFMRYFYVNTLTGEKGPEQLQTVILGQGSSVQFQLDVITANPEHGSVTSVSGEYQDGSTVTIQAIPAQNYAFKRWSDGSTVNPRQIIVDRNISLQAEFVEDIHYTLSIDVSPTGAGSVYGDGTYSKGRMANLNAFPAQGWQFDHWHDEDTGEDTEARRYDFQMYSDRNFTAVFTRILAGYNCVWDVNNPEWGHIEPNQGEIYYEHGEVVELTAVPESDDYMFGRWSDGKDWNPRNVPINKSRHLTAYFWSVYEERLHIEGVHCSVDNDGYDFHIGEEVELTVEPEAGFHFKCWEDDPTAGPIRTITIAEGQPTLRVICESDETYTVELYATPNRGGTVTGAETGLHYGDVVTVEAIPSDGYRFVGWADDDEALAIRTFTVTEDLILEAVFEEIEPEVE